MSTKSQNQKHRNFFLFSAFFLVFVALSLVFTLARAAADSRADAAASRDAATSRLSHVVRTWWQVPSLPWSQHAIVLATRDALTVWIPPGDRLSESHSSPLEYILVSTAPGGAGAAAGAHAMNIGDSWKLYAAGYNAGGHYLGDVVANWLLTGDIIGVVAPTTGISTTLDATTPGTGRVVAAHATATGGSTGDITVRVAALDHIVIEDAAGGLGSAVTTHSMTAGQTFQVWAAGYDAGDSYIGDESVSWSGSGVVSGRLSPLSGMSTTFTAQVAGMGIITATHVTTGSDGTDTITVNPGALDHILIRNEAGGAGSEVTTHAMMAGETFQVWAAGYDAYGNYTGDEPVTWSGTDVVSGRLSTPTGISTTFTAEAVGTGIIQATHETAGSDSTGTITVDPGPLEHVVIRSAQNGGGSPVDTHDMTIYDTLTLWLAGYDVYDNYRGDLSADWEAGGVLAQGVIVPPSGPGITFYPAPVLSGTGTITATYAPAGLVDSTGLVTVRAPRLIISKSDDPDPVSAGAFLLYTLVYTNVGNAVAQNVRITETYDSNVSFVSGGPPPSTSPNIWTRSTLEIGASREIYVTVQANNSMVPNTVLTNVVTIGGPRLERFAFTETTVVTSTPELTLTLESQPDPVDAGGNLVYQIQYANHGNAPASDVTITMTYDSNVTFLSSDTAPITGTNNVWTIKDLPAGNAGSIDVTVVVDGLMSDGDALLSTAFIKSNETALFPDFESTTVNAPLLALTQAATPNPVDANKLLTYTLTYTNVGHADAVSVVLSDPVPSHSSFHSCTAACVRIGDEVRWDLGRLNEGETGSALLVVRVHNNLDSGTVLSNVAGLQALYGYTTTSQITTIVVSAPALWLSIENSVTAVEAGDRLAYTLGYHNTGNSKAYDTTIVATPSLSQYVSAVDCRAPAPASCQVIAGQAVFDVGTVLGGLGGSAVMTVTVEDPLPAGARTLTASAVISTVTPGDPPAGNSVQELDDIVTRPDLILVADYEDIMPYPGKLLTYTLGYRNAGHMDAEDVVVTATLPANTAFQAHASDPRWVTLGDGRYRFEDGDLSLNEGDELLFGVTLTTTHFTTAMTNFDASFEIGSKWEGKKVYVAPLGVPNLVIESVVADSAIFRGLTGTLTITVKNTGGVRACGVDYPDWCSSFPVDIWLDPDTPPQSYPFEEYGTCWVYVDPIDPGESETGSIFFFPDDNPEYKSGECPATTFSEIWLKVDNWDPNTPPYPDVFGYVPEFNEFDNVYGPFTHYSVYLPLLVRNY